MKKMLTLIIALILCYSITNAQDYQVKGNVNSNNKAVEAGTVRLLKQDSSIIKQEVSDKNGDFKIEKIAEGSYILYVKSVGNNDYYSPAFTLNQSNIQKDFGAIALQPSSKLADVVVTSKKQFIEQGIDKTIINIDASPTSVGLSALDLLEKTPGVSVDKDGNISLKGKQGVMVLIDGKPTYLSAQDLANYLRNLPSSALDQFEVMTNPPAKYDAAGNSGIINIKTKKSKTKGFNTSVTVGGGFGKYAKANESINMNYRSGKINLFGNYSYGYNKRYHTLDLVRNFRDSATQQINSVFNQESKMISEDDEHNFKVGMDYYVSKKTTIGVAFNGNFNPGKFSNNNITNILDGTQKLQDITTTTSTAKSNWKNYGANFNTDTKLDTSGSDLSSSFDYIHYYSQSNQLFNNGFFDADGSETNVAQILRGFTPSTINIYSGKIDYTHPMKKDFRFDAGVKSSYVNTDNIANYDTLANGKWVNYAGRTNHFVYKENINAAYINLNKKFNDKWGAQLGLRLENTSSTGNQLTTNESFKRNYTQLFPTAYISYKLNDKNNFGLNYGRRIQRPDYGDLNPFYYFLDIYTYEVGNPYLKPQFSQSIELNHSYNNIINTSFSYTAINDIIDEQLQQIDSIHTTFVSKANLAKQSSFTFSISANIPIAKWWKANVYMQGNYNHFKGIINNALFEANGPSFSSNIQNQFTLPKGWSMELSGWFNGKSVYGTVTGKPQGSLNYAISKNVLKDKGSIKVNVRDFLGIAQWQGYSRYQNVDVQIHNKWESRVVNLSFTYRFNKGQNAEHKDKNAADEEQNRVKGRG